MAKRKKLPKPKPKKAAPFHEHIRHPSVPLDIDLTGFGPHCTVITHQRVPDTPPISVLNVAHFPDNFITPYINISSVDGLGYVKIPTAILRTLADRYDPCLKDSNPSSTRPQSKN